MFWSPLLIHRGLQQPDCAARLSLHCGLEAATDELMPEDRKPEEWLLSEAVPAALPPRGRRYWERWRAVQRVPAAAGAEGPRNKPRL